jgi:hypothetical protein
VSEINYKEVSSRAEDMWQRTGSRTALVGMRRMPVIESLSNQTPERDVQSHPYKHLLCIGI